jgi:hypothetical protein
MSHKLSKSQHSKISQYLQNGTAIAVKGYSHVVCVRNGNEPSWINKGYEIIESHADAHVVGKRKVENQEE